MSVLRLLGIGSVVLVVVVVEAAWCTGPDDDAGFGAAGAGPPSWIVKAGEGPVYATMFWPPALIGPCIGAGWYRGLGLQPPRPRPPPYPPP